MTRFNVHTIGDTFVVVWADDESGLARKVSARKGEAGANYAREVAPGDWRYRPLPGTQRIRFVTVKQVSSLVMKMIKDDTMPKV